MKYYLTCWVWYFKACFEDKIETIHWDSSHPSHFTTQHCICVSIMTTTNLLNNVTLLQRSVHDLLIRSNTWPISRWNELTPIGEQFSTNLSSWLLAVPGSPNNSKLMSPLRVKPSGSLGTRDGADYIDITNVIDYDYCWKVLVQLLRKCVYSITIPFACNRDYVKECNWLNEINKNHCVIATNVIQREYQSQY